MKHVVLFLMVVIPQLSISSPNADNAQRDLDKTCQVFSQAMTIDMKPRERTKHIMRRLEKANVSTEIIQAFDAIFLVTPEDRADVFKKSVSTLIEGDWECMAADRLFSAQ